MRKTQLILAVLFVASSQFNFLVEAQESVLVQDKLHDLFFSEKSEGPQIVKEDPNETPIWSGTADEFYSENWQLVICSAISKDDRAQLEDLVHAHRDDVNIQGRHGMTFVYWAYITGNIAAYKILLENGAKTDVPLTTELELIPSLTRTKGHSVLVHAYRNRDARPGFFETGVPYTKLPNQRFTGGETFAHRCVSDAMTSKELRLLITIISTGIDLNAKTDTGLTACHVAVASNPDGLLILVLAGADTSIPFPDGRQLIDVVRDQCNPAINPLSDHYRVVYHWLALKASKPEVHPLSTK